MKYLKLSIVILLFHSLAQAAFWESSAARAKREFLEFQVDQFAAGISNTKYGPNNVPDAKCIYKTKPLEIPNSRYGITQFEIATSRVGTKERAPDLTGIVFLRDENTLKKTGIIAFAIDVKDQFWRVDRYGIPKGLEETATNPEIDFGDVKYRVVMRRFVENIQDPEVRADLMLYTIGEKPKMVLHGRCKFKKETKK